MTLLASYAPTVDDIRPRRAVTRRTVSAQQSAYTRKLRALGAEIDAPTRAEGSLWYASVASELDDWSAAYGTDRESAAIVLALLSPRCNWAKNVDAARAVLAAWSNGREVRPHGPLPANTDRAYAFLAGHAPFSTDPLGALKTRSFAANVAGDEDYVTVDVWAARAVGVDADRMTPYQYAAIARSYRLVARELEMTPAAFQAAVWIHVRGTGA